MRLTMLMRCSWREAATVMMFAKRGPKISANQSDTASVNNPSSHPASAKYDYRLLMLERSSKSSFMPSAYVFPGGGISNADISADWIDIYRQLSVADVNLSIPKPKQNTDERAPMLTRSRDWPICSDVAFRICSIRETFEEAGILLCKHKSDINKAQSNDQDSPVDSQELQEWRPLIQKDAGRFMEMCQRLSVVPDIWSLYEWSCWLTPTNMEKLHSGRRYDTAFYICGLPEHVDAVHDQQEIVSSKWVSIPETLHGYYQEKVWLAPPQIYEIRRMANFRTFEGLQEFSAARQSHGCVRWMPVRMSFKDATGAVAVGAVLPGDDMYPEDVDWEGTRPPPEILQTFTESLSQAKNAHRFDFRSFHDTRLHCNIPQGQGHMPPMPVDDILRE